MAACAALTLRCEGIAGASKGVAAAILVVRHALDDGISIFVALRLDRRAHYEWFARMPRPHRFSGQAVERRV